MDSTKKAQELLDIIRVPKKSDELILAEIELFLLKVDREAYIEASDSFREIFYKHKIN